MRFLTIESVARVVQKKKTPGDVSRCITKNLFVWSQSNCDSNLLKENLKKNKIPWKHTCSNKIPMSCFSWELLQDVACSPATPFCMKFRIFRFAPPRNEPVESRNAEVVRVESIVQLSFLFAYITLQITWLWFQIFFIFTPTWGNDPIWQINIFQRGWNHQLDKYYHIPSIYGPFLCQN